jgi:hypothetical protein
MSADNWALCPKCQKGVDPYAVSTGERYLREDWEIGIVGDEFNVVYSAWCLNPVKCDFQHRFEHEQVVGENYGS